MKVLVIGSGAREHALCWKIAQSDKVDKIYAIPGNGGIGQVAECVDIRPDDIKAVLEFAKSHAIDLTVVGPEAPLVKGIVDLFTKNGLKIFGPDKYLAQLEGSKVFAKEKMRAFGVPTADFKIFDDPADAKRYIDGQEMPLVIKADGLAGGKGVVVAESKEQARQAIDMMMVAKAFGSAGDRVVIEECLAGEEASIIIVADGKDFVVLASSQDHKRVFDADKGPNTGGMGAYSPAPVVTQQRYKNIEKDIIQPFIRGLAREATPYKGVIYIGLMINDTGAYVLEFNVRFGDPETQAILPRLQTDIIDLIQASLDVRLKDLRLQWNPNACVCVVCAAPGYPGEYKKGLTISGLEEAGNMDDVVVFHAGTMSKKSASEEVEYQSTGGRVLGVTALGEDIRVAIDKAYAACSKISFEGMHYRRDIGYRAIDRLNV